MKTIRICTLIRNRAWILPYYLEHIYNLEYDKKLITIHFLVNNSTDSSLNLLQEFKEKHNSKYNNIIIEENNKSNLSEDNRDMRSRIANGIYHHLAEMRNYLFNKCKEDYLFNIDSDILVEKYALKKLVSSNKDMIAGTIYNGYQYSDEYWNYTNLCLFRLGENKINNIKVVRNSCYSLKRRDIRLLLRENKTIIELDLTGAICLYSKKLYSDKTIRFGFHLDGEDYAYCLKAKEHGYKIYGNISSYSQHIMSKYWLEKYKNNERIY